MRYPQARALVIDDDPWVRETLVGMLATEVSHVAGAASGAEALAWLSTNPPPGVIVLDLMMPAMSGWDLLEELRLHPSLARTPVIVLSALRPQALPRFPVAAWLSKPVSREKLAEALQSCLPAPEPPPPPRDPDEGWEL